MSQQELLKLVLQALDEAQIPYMLTGSLVSSLQGEPRSTHDIDIIVSIEQASTEILVKSFTPPDYYLDQNAINEAVTNDGMFNLINTSTGDKIDFWMLTDQPFDKSRFMRRYIEDIMGMKIMITSPEDTILAKLNWAKLSGGSEKQFTDALRVFEVQFEKLDMQYLNYWAHELDIEEQEENIKIKGNRKLSEIERWQRRQKAHREFKQSL